MNFELLPQTRIQALGKASLTTSGRESFPDVAQEDLEMPKAEALDDDRRSHTTQRDTSISMGNAEGITEADRRQYIVLGKKLAEKTKREVRDELHQRFENQKHLPFSAEERELLMRTEVEKTEMMRSFIKLIAESQRVFWEDVGVEYVEIPERNIHFIPEETIRQTFCKRYNTPVYYFAAFYDPVFQGIYAKAELMQEDLLKAIHILSHEMYHMRSQESFMVDKAGESSTHRSGLSMTRTKTNESGETSYQQRGNPLNEALTEDMNVRTLLWLLDNDEAFGVIANVLGFEANDSVRVKLKDKIHNGSAYKRERVAFEYIVDAIYQNEGGRFTSKDQVKNVFFRAYAGKGTIEPFRLIKKCFGNKGVELVMADRIHSSEWAMPSDEEYKRYDEQLRLIDMERDFFGQRYVKREISEQEWRAELLRLDKKVSPLAPEIIAQLKRLRLDNDPQPSEALLSIDDTPGSVLEKVKNLFQKVRGFLTRG